MHLPADVSSVTAAFLESAGRRAPGLIEGLYLHGSLGFGEYFPGASDIDFVAVPATRPDDAQLAGLAAALQGRFQAAGRFSVNPVTWHELPGTASPCTARASPAVRSGPTRPRCAPSPMPT